MSETTPVAHLIFRCDAVLCALSLAYVAETMRPLPCEPLAAMPSFLVGVSLIRGVAVPIVDLGRLLGSASTIPARRFITVKVGDRRVGLAVQEILGIRSIPAAALGGVPPLLTAAASDAISTIARLDAELLMVLREARIAPESVWTALESSAALQ